MYKLSIIIPIYNAEKYLKECLSSLKIDKNNDIEYILIDDGSTDKSCDIYEKYRKFDNVVIIKNENKGVSFSRNMGIKISHGQYIMFVDSDDFLTFNWRKCLDEYIEDEKYDLVIFSKFYNGEKISISKMKEACLGAKDSNFSICSIMAPVSKLYYRKFLIDEKILFDEEIINGEDLCFNLEILYKTIKIKVDNKNIYMYRQNFNSSTNKFHENIVKSDIKFQKKISIITKGDKDYKVKQLRETLCLNAIYLIINRLSISNKKKQEQIMIIEKMLKNEVYYLPLEKYKIYKNNLNFLQKLILRLVIIKKYNISLNILKYRNKIKKMLKKEIISIKEI